MLDGRISRGEGIYWSWGRKVVVPSDAKINLRAAWWRRTGEMVRPARRGPVSAVRQANSTKSTVECEGMIDRAGTGRRGLG